MNLTKTLLMAIVLAAAGAFIWRHEHLTLPAVTDSQGPIKVLDVSGHDVSSIGVISPGGAYTIEKSGEKDHEAWLFRQPAGAKADSQKVAGIILSLSRLAAQNVIEKDEVGGDQALYGLVPPELILSVGGAFGKRVFSFGKKVQLSGRRYLQPEGDGRIFLVEEGIFTLLKVAPNEIRDRKPVDFEPTAVTQVSLLRGSGDLLTLTRNGTTWSGKHQSKDFAVDTELAAQKILALKNIKVSKFVDEAADLSLYGLVLPRLVVSLRLGTDDAKKYVIEFGEGEASGESEEPDHAGQKAYFFKIADSPFVYQLANPVIADLLRGPEFFYPRKPLAELKAENITALELAKSEGASFKVHRMAERSGWEVEADGKTQPASPDLEKQIATLIDHALAVTVLTYYSETDAAETENGLAHPVQTLKIFVKDKEAPILLVIGDAVQDRGNRASAGSSRPEHANENPRWIAVTQLDGSFFPGMVSSVTSLELSNDLTALGQK